MRVEAERSLARAFGIRAGDLVSTVGAGGKTALVYRLVRELTSAGVPVVATTTTRVWYPAEETMPEVVVGEGNDSHIEVLRSVVAERGFAMSGSSESGGKLLGHSPEFLDELMLSNPGWAVVAECDGARGASLKVPAEHEPPLPSRTSVYVVVIGVDCIGERIDSSLVFNAERVAAVTGVDINARVDEEIAATSVLSADSYLGRRPGKARMHVLLNKAVLSRLWPRGIEGTAAQGDPVMALALKLLASGEIEAVAAGSAGGGDAASFAILR